METAEEFIRRYLQMKADLRGAMSKAYVPFYEKYFTNDWNNYRSDVDAKRRDEEFVTIEMGDQTARAITIEPFKNMENRRRYILCVVDGQWKISGKESECFNCHGSGKYGDLKCTICDGVGWKDYLRSTT